MQKKTWGVLMKGLAGVVAIFVLLFLNGVGVGFYSAHAGTDVDTDRTIVIVVGVMATLIMALALWVGVAWMRSIDEAAQEAHKAAWFYGGSAGLSVGGVAFILATLPQAETLVLPGYAGRTDPAAYAATGALAMMGLMMIGYTAVWLWWWWRRR